ncbi:nitroreductase family protein [Megasphaera sp. WILCCON 0056]|uniref:nitroreductase family protein n=1 Tax=Megasphaera sp. WILCCON 0056 TaxID=3345340 RepID=UPI003A811C87
MDAMFHRSSIRKFQNRPVEEAKIREILKAAMQAPSAGNQQPWEFYIVTDEARKKALSQVSPYAGCAAQAPAVIITAYRTQGATFPVYAQIDTAIAETFLWLAADAAGLGGVWLGIAPQEERMTQVEAILDLPRDQRAFALFPIGYPAETKAHEDRFDPSRIHFI